MKTKCLIFSLLVLFSFSMANAQVGKLKNLKDKAKSTVNGGGSSSSSTATSVGKSETEKLIKEGDKLYEAGDIVGAWAKYCEAKNAAKVMAETTAANEKIDIASPKAGEYYQSEYDKAVKSGDCDAIRKILNERKENKERFANNAYACQGNGWKETSEQEAYLKDCEGVQAGQKQADQNAAAQPKQDALLEEANAMIEAGNYAGAKAKINEAYNVCPTCDGANKLPDLAASMDKMVELDDMRYTCQEKYYKENEGITGKTHEKYMKKIVFSKSVITKGSENESNFTNSFSLTDDIYARMYFERPVNDEPRNIGDCFGQSNLGIRMIIDDGKTELPKEVDLVFVYESTKGAGDTYTSQEIVISPSSTDAKNITQIDNSRLFNKLIEYLPAGSHKIKIQAYYNIPEDEKEDYYGKGKAFTTRFGEEKILAEGEFTINVKDADKRAYYKKLCPIYQFDIDNYKVNTFSLVSDATSRVKSSKNIDWNKFTLLKISGKTDWTYEKNVYGVILSRSTSAIAWLLNKEDGLVYQSNLSFYQENISSGGSKYGPVTHSVEEMNPEYVRNFGAFCKECIGK